jgi:hypothetical protein
VHGARGSGVLGMQGEQIEPQDSIEIIAGLSLSFRKGKVMVLRTFHYVVCHLRPRATPYFFVTSFPRLR